LKIAHIVKSSHNIGEGALINGMHRVLREDLKRNLEFDLIDRKHFQALHGKEYLKGSVSKRFDNEFINFLNKNYKLLIIGGGGIIQTGQYDNFGGLVIAGDLDSLKNLDIPLVVYAAGDNRFSENDNFEYGKELSNLIREIESSNNLFSLRNDLSKERLLSFIDKDLHNQIKVIPDPGFYINVDKISHPLIRKNKKNIVLQLAGDRINKRIKNENENSNFLDYFVENILESIKIISKKYDINVILSPHIPADYFLINKFIEKGSTITVNGSGIIRELFDFNFCSRGFSMASSFFSLYDQADLVVGMRGHAAICSIGLGTPFIALDSHPKVLGVMKDVNLINYSIDPSLPNLSLNLSNMIESLLQNSNLWREERNKQIKILRQKTSEFHKLISDII